MQITSLDQLKKKAQGELIELPGWDEESFVARVKRVSMLGLASKGKIPNALLSSAQKIFTSRVDEETTLEDISGVMKVIAEETLVEPSMDQLKEIGLELTDEQLTSLLNYSQMGVKSLERFRTNKTGTQNNQSE